MLDSAGSRRDTLAPLAGEVLLPERAGTESKERNGLSSWREDDSVVMLMPRAWPEPSGATGGEAIAAAGAVDSWGSDDLSAPPVSSVDAEAGRSSVARVVEAWVVRSGSPTLTSVGSFGAALALWPETAHVESKERSGLNSLSDDMGVATVT